MRLRQAWQDRVAFQTDSRPEGLRPSPTRQTLQLGPRPGRKLGSRCGTRGLSDTSPVRAGSSMEMAEIKPRGWTVNRSR